MAKTQTAKEKKAAEAAAEKAAQAEATKKAEESTPQGDPAPENNSGDQSAAPAKNGENKNPPDADSGAGPATDDQGDGKDGDGKDGAGTPGEAPNDAPPSTATPEQAEEEKLYSLEALAGEFRVPSWQTAALHRMMKWETGKKVSKKDYTSALELLKKRPLGR